MTAHITFLSDFGTKDEFVGVVHGVIATLAPDVRVIDLTHTVPRGDVRAGALALMRAVQYIPDGVVLAVVDPGVGTTRRALAAETSKGVFIGPDNGLLSPAVALLGGATRIVSIENPEMRIPSPGATFHGRDVFGPAAGMVASGQAAIGDLGPDVDPDTVMPLLLPLPEVEENKVVGMAWWIDVYGNVETNIGPDDLTLAGIGRDQTVTVTVGSTGYEIPWVDTYAEVAEGEPLLHVDSAGLMAVAVHGGSAAADLNLEAGMALTMAG